MGYYNSDNGETYLLCLHQAIEIAHLDYHLLFPFQCRMHGIKVNDTAKFLTPVHTPSSHAITLTDPYDESRDLHFPFGLKGVTSYLPVFKPSMDDYTSNRFSIIDLTDEHLE